MLMLLWWAIPSHSATMPEDSLSVDSVSPDSDEFVTASLLISAPLKVLYSVFGHATLRMECPTHDLDFIYKSCREIVEGGRLVEKEGLSADCDPVNFLAVVLDFAVRGYLHPGHLFYEVFKHGVIEDPERGGVVDDGISPDLDWVAYCGNPCGIQRFAVLL